MIISLIMFTIGIVWGGGGGGGGGVGPDSYVLTVIAALLMVR